MRRWLARLLLVERQTRRAATEPGQIQRVIVARRLAGQQIAPGFDRGLGFPDVFEKGSFAVVELPATGFIHLGEMLQPSLREITPARNQFAAPGGLLSMCHNSARKRETDAAGTTTNHMITIVVFGGKLRLCPANVVNDAPPIPKTPQN